MLDDGVPAVEGLLRGQGDHLGAPVSDLVARAGETLPHRVGAAVREAVDLVALLGDEGARFAQHGPPDEGVEVAPFGGEAAAQALAEPRAVLREGGLFGGQIRYDELGGVRRGRGASVGDVIEQRRVDVVPDGADDGSARGADGPHERLVAEPEQVLEGAAAARDDDDVDVVETVEFAQGAADGGDAVGALDGNVADLEVGGRPAASRVLDDVVLGCALAAGDEPDDAGQERQRPFAVGGEQALCGERALELFEAQEQFALADGPHRAALHHEAAALRPERRFGVHDDARPFTNRGAHRVERVRRNGEGEGHVDVGVPQRQIRGAGADVELHDLPLDPQRRHAIDVLRDLHAEHAHRPRLLGGRVAREGRKARRRARAWGCARHGATLRGRGARLGREGRMRR